MTNGPIGPIGQNTNREGASAPPGMQTDPSRMLNAGEASIIEQIKAGDTHLFFDLVQPHQSSVGAICYALLHNRADAEEVSQETMLKALSHIGELRSGDSFRSWLMRIAVNEARMRRRRDRKLSAIKEEIGSIQEAGVPKEGDFRPRDFADWREIPSEVVERKEFAEIIHSALQSLESIYREVFVLRDIENLNVAQTAAILGITEAAVTTRLHRARLQMREQLAPFFRKPGPSWMPLTMMKDMGKQLIKRTVSCKRVMSEVSNYIDGELDPLLRAKIEEHLQVCHRCSILYDTTRTMLFIVGDEKIFRLPVEYNDRLQRFVVKHCRSA